MESATDEVLMRRVVESDDERALSELYDRYGGLVYAARVRYLGDRTLTEDLVQDVFFSVWHNAASFDPSKVGFSTWIYRVARNRAVDLARRRQRRMRIVAPRMSEEALSEHDEGGDAEEILRTFDVVGAPSEISPVQREVPVLAYFRGLSQREISHRTGTPLGTVKSRTTAALRAVRKRMLAKPRTVPAKMSRTTGGLRMNEHGNTREDHTRVWELLARYVLGALNPDEEKSVEQHLAGCVTCREEEHGLRETHEHLAETSVAASSAPSDLKARLLAGLPPRDGSEAASGGAARGASRFASWTDRVAAAAAAVLLLIALASMAYSAGFSTGRRRRPTRR